MISGRSEEQEKLKLTCEREHIEQRERELRERELKKQREHCRGAAAIPPRFQAASFENFAASSKKQRIALEAVREYAASFKENARAGKCLVLVGSVGTGKTHLGTALALSLADHCFSVKYCQAQDVIRSIKATWAHRSEQSEGQAIRAYISPTLLIVDEVGVGFGSETEARLMGEVIDGRYRESKPTVIISNLDEKGMRDILGARAMDRLFESGNKVVVFDWPSYRRSREIVQARSAFASSPVPENDSATIGYKDGRAMVAEIRARRQAPSMPASAEAGGGHLERATRNA